MSNADNSYAVRLARKKGEILRSFHEQNPGKSIEQNGNAASPSSAYTATVLGDGLYIRQKEEGGTVAEGCCLTDSTVSIVPTENGFIVIGTYQSSTFNLYNLDGSLSLISLPLGSGFQHGFIVKYNTAGVVEWATHAGGDVPPTTNLDVIRRITKDSDGNIYVIGNYFSLNFYIYSSTDNTTAAYTLTRTGGGPTAADIFLAKYNAFGIVQWVTSINGEFGEFGNNIILDSFNNLYIVGTYGAAPVNVYSSVDLINPAYIFTVNNSSFFIKYNANGIFQWATRMTGQSGSSCIGLTVDHNNNICVSGIFGPTFIDIYGTDNAFIRMLNAATSGSSTDVFIAKYNPTGIVQWATRMTGSGGEFAVSNIIDSNNNVYVTGQFASTELRIYSANSLTSVLLPNIQTTTPNTDVYVVKFNENGNVLWATRISGTGTDVAGGITIDNDDNIYVCGNYNNPGINIYSTSSTTPIFILSNINPVGTNNTFIVKYNSDGMPQFARYITSTGTVSFGGNINTDNDSNFYLAGTYSTIPLTIYNEVNQPLSTITTVPTGGSDVYNVKINKDGGIVFFTRIGGGGSADIAGGILPV
jgi:hypothetical protein